MYHTIDKPTGETLTATGMNNIEDGIAANDTAITGRNLDINYDLYNNSGQLIGQINWTNHNNPKQHPFGKKGEHKHIIKWINNKMQRGKAEKLSKNDYILFGGEENDN